MGRVQKHVLSLTTASDGTASGVINFGFNSDYQSLIRVKVDYSATAAAGTDITITDGDGVVVYTLTDVNTDFDSYLADTDVKGPANAAITNAQRAPLVRGPLTVAVAQGGDTKTNEVTVWLQN